VIRRFAFVLLLFFTTSAVLRAQPDITTTYLQNLLDSGEYFLFSAALEEKLSMEAYQRPDEQTLSFIAWNNFLFNESKTSNGNIHLLLNTPRYHCTDSMAAEMLVLHFQNDIRLFQYKSADSVCTLLLSKYSAFLDGETIREIKNTSAIVKALVNIPPQTIERQGDFEINYKRDLVNLIRIPVTINEETEDFIFDTGANFSCITESQAKEMGIKMLDADFAVTSSSKSALSSKLGVADKLMIGNITFRNVVFIVLPDKSLKFAGGIYKIRGIIGLPVIAQMKQVTITKAGKLLSTEKYSGVHKMNMGLEGNTPFVSVNFYGQDHNYVFDTGAAASVFGNKFYTVYKDSLASAEEGTAHMGGAGGVQKVSTRVMKHVHYGFGGMTGILKSITIQQSGVTDVLGQHYGIVGEDIFMQWETMVINFDGMFVEVK
jgi:predicted aspartyl protease